MSNFKILIEETLKLSIEKNHFEKAASEWFVFNLKKSEDAETCLCTKHPIYNLCYIKNSLNGEETLVGNCCVKHYGLNYDWFFSNIQKLKNNKRPNKAFVDFLFNNGHINDWENKFLLNMCNKKKLSEKQKLIEQKIIYKLKKRFI